MMHNGFATGFGHFGNWLCGPGAFFPGPVGWLITLLFWGVMIYLLIILLRALFAGGKGSSDNHMERLKERYARGEINEDEYLRMKSELAK